MTPYGFSCNTRCQRAEVASALAIEKSKQVIVIGTHEGIDKEFQIFLPGQKVVEFDSFEDACQWAGQANQ